MCGRFTQHHKIEEVAERFEFDLLDESVGPRFNIAPTQNIPIIYQSKQHEREMMFSKWGLIPYWAKDPSIGNKLINARAETLAEKPSFKRALKQKRCIIPADGFYEWPKKNGKKTGGNPLYIRLKGGELFGFAGLWEEWKSPEDEIIRSFTIITVEPNELVSQFHHRMAAILEPGDEQAWLDINTPMEEALAMLNSYDAEKMEAFEVSKSVNSPSSDDSSLIQKI